MGAVAGLDLFGSPWADLANWVVASIVLAGGCVILYSQLTATTSVQSAFTRKGDPMLARIDVPTLLRAAENGFPSWVWTLQNVRHAVVFGASILVLAAMVVS
jgi:hypothetical protein